MFLTRHGLSITATNVELGNGELDILASDGGARVVLEVRTTSGEEDPIDAIDHAKRRRVERLARRIGADRVDFVGVRVGREALDVHWVPGSN